MKIDRQRTRLVRAVRGGRVLVSDGAWGTLLQQRGLRPGECPEVWCLSRPDDVRAVAAGYRAAGADLVETNSFGASRFKLAAFALDGQSAEVCEAAARLSREAAGSGWVIASLGPTGKLLAAEDITEAELYEDFRVQVEAFERGGADAVCIETMLDAGEAVQAIRAAKDHTGLEVICTFTFDRTVRGDYRTMMGLSPADAARAAVEAGADLVGTNCGNGLAGMVPIVAEMRRACPGVPLLVHANAGLPVVAADGSVSYPETPEAMAALVPDLVAAGVSVIGGCCGTTPAHIAALAAAVRRLQPSSSAR